MKRFRKIVLGVLTAGMVILAPCANVLAAGSVSITGDKENAAVGDSFTVNINVQNEEDAAVAPEVSVNYDVNRLSFVSCSGEYGGGAGGFITLSEGTYDISFTILSGGQADVDVAAIFDGDGANIQTVTASVMVEGEDTAAVNEYAREDAGTGVEASQIPTADGTKVVSSVFASEFMPVGFSKTTVSYEEQMVEAAQFDMGNMVLLYVTDLDGNNGNFDVYDQNTGELSDFLQISGIENRFIIALRASEDVEVPAGFEKATLQWNAQTLEAYAYTGEESEDSAIPSSDFFLIYAISSEGNKGWYMYDQNEGTYQRYLGGLHSVSTTPSTGELISQIATPVNKEAGDEKGTINIAFIIAVALAVLLIALIITVIVMGVKLREYNSYDYIDEDDEFEDGGNSFLRAASGDMDSKMPRYEEMQTRDDDGEKAEVKPPVSKDEIQPKAIAAPVSKTKEDLVEDRLSDDDDFFSPREKIRPTRSEKKAAKLEEKARKKYEKQMKKEYGEFGPVDWQSWQDAVDGGEKTAAMASRSDGVPAGMVNTRNEEVIKPENNTMGRQTQGRSEQEIIEDAIYEENIPAKDNPRDMIKNIPANDNKAPVQARPIQQFEFDDDFEFEFLDLDDDD